MAAVMVNTPDLLSLKEQFAERLSACKELDNFFCEGARVIDQDADVSRLHKLTASLKELFDKIRLREISEKSQMAGWDMAIEIGHLLATAVGAVNEAHGLVEGADRVIERRAARQHTFGNIMVLVGKNGIPDDVSLESISEIARRLNRPEPDVIQDIRQKGNMLFTPDEFWKLIDRIASDIRRGKCRLPISLDYLMPMANIQVKLQPAVKIIPVT